MAVYHHIIITQCYPYTVCSSARSFKILQLIRTMAPLIAVETMGPFNEADCDVVCELSR
jgi:hypothetical protein